MGRKRSPAFPLERLPEEVRERVFEKPLVSREPIIIDFYWLRSFVNGHVRVPSAAIKAEVNGSTYTLPVDWNDLLGQVDNMKTDMAPFKKALEIRNAKTRATRSPARGLSTALLRVSRTVSRTAARVFYSQNVFKFPCPSSAWLQMEAFLTTIGPRNVSEMQHIHAHVPLWHRGIMEDFVEGAIIDQLSPASKLAVIRPPARDRLLSAIQSTQKQLMTAFNLKSLVLLLGNGMDADYWSGRYVNVNQLISISDAEAFVDRKATGIAMLKEASTALAVSGNRPLLEIHQHSTVINPVLKDFRRRLPAIVAEAEKYGWQVDPRLK